MDIPKKQIIIVYILNSKRNHALFKVYTAISDSLENCKIINCIVFSIALNY